MPRFSVIIPCHNAAAYIGEALRSVAAQEVAPHEVIVINDASTDDSAAAVRRSGVDVRLIDLSVRNAAAARHAGIEVATGDWIAFLDADDIWYPNHLANAAEVLGNSSDVGYMGNHVFLRADGSIESIPPSLRPKIDETRSGLSHLFFAELMVRGFHFGHSTEIIRRDRYMEVGGFDFTQKRRHDMDLWLRVICGRTWAWDARPQAQYRIDTPGSISKSIINAEYYFLRALTKNRDGFAGEAMDSLIATAARRSVSLAFADGTEEDYRAARELAGPFLSRKLQAAYRIADFAPGLVRAAIRIKRRVYWTLKRRLKGID